MFDLAGRLAMVTGGSRGIGLAAATGLAKAGADLVLVARDPARLDEAAARLREFGRAVMTRAVNLAELVASETLIDTARPPDILVNCAGGIARGSIAAVSDQEWNGVFDVNVTALMRLSRLVAPHMEAKNWGRIIYVSSISALGGMAERTAYCASKAAVLGLTRSLAAELALSGITVNAICPGSFPTDFNRPLQASAAFQERLKLTTPLQRWGRLDELEAPFVFLASTEASYVTGHALVVDGGTTATI